MHRSGTPVSNRRCRRGSSHRRTTRCFGYVGRSLPATGLADGTFQDGDGPIVIIAIVPDHVTSVEIDGTILTPTNNIWHRTTTGSTSPRIQNDGLAGLTGGTQISSRRIGRVRRPAFRGSLSTDAAALSGTLVRVPTYRSELGRVKGARRQLPRRALVGFPANRVR